MRIQSRSRGVSTAVTSTAVAISMSLGAASAVHAQIAVTSPTIVETTGEPGTTYRDAIVIHNSSNSVQTVSLSRADYRFDAEGLTEFTDAGTEPRSNSEWIVLSQQSVSVLPHADVAVSYTVSIPSSPVLPVGTYWSVIFVEANRPATSTSTSLSIVPTFRYAVQIATHIGKTGEPKLAFSEPHVMRSSFSVALVNTSVTVQTPTVSTLPAERSLSIDVEDVGTRACRPTLRLELYQQDGALAHAATVQRGLVYPGASIRQTFALPALPPGVYTVLLLADTGVDKVQGTKFQIHIQ
jgi:hypothetical protein